MDGWTDTVDGWTYANTIIGTLILFKTLSYVLVFFSLEALFLGKALAQIFSVLRPSLLGRWPHWRVGPDNHEQIQGPTARKAAQAEPAILSTTSHMIKPKRSQQEDTNNNYQISNNCTTASICLPSVSTLQTSFYLLLTLQNFTVRKSQHLQSGFRFLLSVRLFLQALLAICSFFRFCYSCMYCVRLGLQWQEWRRWIMVNFQGHTETDSHNTSPADSEKIEIRPHRICRDVII